jgi:thiol-disulfide isomerase/thioredoxin
MKKKIILTIVVMLSSFLGYFGYTGFKRQALNNEVEKNMQWVPNYSFYDLDGGKYSNGLVKGNPMVFIYFHPECEHCQYEAEQLLLKRDSFKGVQLVMVSPAPIDAVKQFFSSYHLTEIENLDVLWDKENKFESYFGESIFPTVIIYDNQGKLRKKYKGEVSIETIIQQLT